MNIQGQLGTTEFIRQVEFPSPVNYIQVFNPLFRQILDDSAEDLDHCTVKENMTLPTHLQFVDMEQVRKSRYPYTAYPKPVFIKYAPLLDPLKYMTGKYDTEPEIKKQKMMTWAASEAAKSNLGPVTKYQDLNNASYVDALFCYLNSRLLHDYQFIHALDFYGVYLGVQESFQLNIIDDYDYLDNFNVFHQKVKKGEIILSAFQGGEDETDSDSDEESRTNHTTTRVVKRTLKWLPMEDDVDAELDIEELKGEIDPPMEPMNPSEMTLEYDARDQDAYESDSSQEENTDDESSESDSGSESGSDSSDEHSSDYETIDSREEDEETDSSHDEEEWIAHIKDFPVALICLEKCQGTLDSLFEKGVLNVDECMSIAFQIVITLALYQRLFQFTHNDLHTHNIMYQPTEIETLYYIYQGRHYAIPTFGRVIKIIDFGRSVYRFKNRKITSDGFSPTGDANSQYNTEPYYNPKKKRVEENPAFDLCRLGCSIYDFVLDKDMKPEEMDSFQRMVNKWCQDDRGKNILYKATGKERYPNFKLYKMIARAVHQHTPDNQWDEFESFLVPDETATQNPHWPWMNLDAIPSFL